MLFLCSQLPFVHLLILGRLRPANHLGCDLRWEENRRLGVRYHNVAWKHGCSSYPYGHIPIHADLCGRTRIESDGENRENSPVSIFACYSLR